MADKLGLEAVLELDTKQFDRNAKKAEKKQDSLLDKFERRQKRHDNRIKLLGFKLEEAKKQRDKREIRRLETKLRFIELREKGHQKRLTRIMLAGERARSFLGRRRGSGGAGAVAGGGVRATGAAALGGGVAATTAARARNVIGLAGFVSGALGVGVATTIGAKVAKDWIAAGDAIETYQAQLNLLLSKRGALRQSAGLQAAAKEFAATTKFTAADVRASQISALAAGAKTDQIDTLIKRMGELAAFNNVQLQEVARPIARLFAGDFGEAFERLRDFRISRQDLTGAGARFTKGGQFQGTPEQAVEAVVNVIQTKFGGVLEGSLLTLEGKTNRLASSFAILGENFSNVVNPSIKNLVDGLNDAVNSDIMKNAVNDLGISFKSVLEDLKELKKEDIANVFKLIGNTFISTSRALAAIATSSAFRSFLEGLNAVNFAISGTTQAETTARTENLARLEKQLPQLLRTEFFGKKSRVQQLSFLTRTFGDVPGLEGVGLRQDVLSRKLDEFIRIQKIQNKMIQAQNQMVEKNTQNIENQTNNKRVDKITEATAGGK